MQQTCPLHYLANSMGWWSMTKREVSINKIVSSSLSMINYANSSILMTFIYIFNYFSSICRILSYCSKYAINWLTDKFDNWIKLILNLQRKSSWNLKVIKMTALWYFNILFALSSYNSYHFIFSLPLLFFSWTLNLLLLLLLLPS